MLLERKLHLLRESPPLEADVALRIVSVEKHPEKEIFVCVWSLDYLAPRAVGYGEDALSALANALQVIRLFIRDSLKDGVSVWWKEPGDCGGIPEIKRESEFK